MAATLATDLIFALSRLDREVRLRGGSSALRPADQAVLSDLRDAGPVTPGAVAAAEHMRPASLTRRIVALEKLGLIKRARAGDKRSALLSLTQAGRTALADATRDAWLARRIAQLTEQEQADLRAALPVLTTLYATTDNEIAAEEEPE